MERRFSVLLFTKRAEIEISAVKTIKSDSRYRGSAIIASGRMEFLLIEVFGLELNRSSTSSNMTRKSREWELIFGGLRLLEISYKHDQLLQLLFDLFFLERIFL